MNIQLHDSLQTMTSQNFLFENVWPEIEPLIKGIFTNNTLTKCDWQSIFWKVHSACMWDPRSATLLQQKLRELCDNYIAQEKNFINVNSRNILSMMKAYNASWKRFMFYYTYVPLPFAPLEKIIFRSAAINESNKNESFNFIRLSMLELWVINIFADLRDQLIHGAMLLVDAERKNQLTDSQLIIGIKESCVYLCKHLAEDNKVYNTNFENLYLLSIECYYQNKGQEYYNKHGTLLYIKWVDQKLKEEMERANRYLEPQSLPKVIEVCVKTMVASHKEIFSEQFVELMKNNDIFSLNLMFLLLNRIENGVDLLLKKFENYITTIGLENLKMDASNVAQDSDKYIENLLKLFDLATTIVKKAFASDSRFLTARDIAINKIINDKSVFSLQYELKTNSNQMEELNANLKIKTGDKESDILILQRQNKILFENRNAELIANYCDTLLRRNNVSRHLSSEQIEAKLKNAILLLKYLHDKDVFMKYYKSHLTRRLILETSLDLDKEEMMVNWLREVGMPAEYVNKISRMFQDLKVSEDFTNQFKLNYDWKKQSDDFISIKILNSSTWSRNRENIDVLMPNDISDWLPKIEEFYQDKHSGRKLIWHYPYSYGILTFHSNHGSYDLEVSLYQAVVLFCWNDCPNDSITIESLSHITRLPILDLRRILWPLVANSKLKNQLLLTDLKCVRHLNDLQNNLNLRLNVNFFIKGKNGKIVKRGQINLIGRLQLQMDKCGEDEMDNIVKLRILRVQEAIMKIIKMRKTIDLNALYLEINNVLKEMFVPSKTLIENQVDWLIENKYIQRDPTDQNLLIYI